MVCSIHFCSADIANFHVTAHFKNHRKASGDMDMAKNVDENFDN